MLEKDKNALRDASPYNAAITREQFLFYEVRTTAKLVCEGLGNDEIVERIGKENLFQYPTEKSVKKMALACLTSSRNCSASNAVLSKRRSSLSRCVSSTMRCFP